METESLPVARFSSQDAGYIFDLLKSKNVCVLATQMKHGVHMSVVHYSVDDSFTVYFATKDGTRKHAHLQNDDALQLIMFDTTKQVEVCVDGRASEVQDGMVRTKIVNELYKIASRESNSAPPISKLYVGDYVAYAVRPTKITAASFLDYKGGDSRIFKTLTF